MIEEKENAHPPSASLEKYVRNIAFPCVAAKSAAQRGQIVALQAGSLLSNRSDADILAGLHRFTSRYRRTRPIFATFAVIFSRPGDLTEKSFERALWQRLAGLHALDRRRCGWDPRVSADPDSPDFSFSLCGEAFFIIGMHPRSSRRSRRFPRPALVFNMHDQFERLRQQGVFERMRDTIRTRDAAYCGRPNPELANFGNASEARQYSGRAVSAAWRCPFRPKPQVPPADAWKREAAE